MKAISVNIDNIHIDPANLRMHPARNLDTIKASLARFGQQKPIVVDGNGICRAGNGTLEAARALGWAKIDVVKTPLAGSEAIAYAIADNRTAELALWDDDRLGETLKALQLEDFNLDDIGFSQDELDELLGPEFDGEAADDPGAQIDRAEELQAKWGTARGQLWEIGRHRLLCGDSTNAEDVARVMGGEKAAGCFTSPPYAEQRKDQYGGTPADQYIEWWSAIQANARAALADDGSFFVNIKAHCDEGERSLYVMDLVLAMRRQFGWRYEDEFAWVHGGTPKRVQRKFKNGWESVHHFAISYDVKIRPRNVMHESESVPIWAPENGSRGAKDTSKAQGHVGAVAGCDVSEGMAFPSNVVKTGKNSEALGHAAAFPVSLPAFFLKAFSDEGDIWFEPFCGSGTTIVAAEQTGRVCYGIEIEPKYCAVILERLAGMGLNPILAKDKA